MPITSTKWSSTRVRDKGQKGGRRWPNERGWIKSKGKHAPSRHGLEHVAEPRIVHGYPHAVLVHVLRPQPEAHGFEVEACVEAVVQVGREATLVVGHEGDAGGHGGGEVCGGHVGRGRRHAARDGARAACAWTWTCAWGAAGIAGAAVVEEGLGRLAHGPAGEGGSGGRCVGGRGGCRRRRVGSGIGGAASRGNLGEEL